MSVSFARRLRCFRVKIKDLQTAELAYVKKDLYEVVGCRIVGSLLSVDDAWNFDLSRASPSMDGLECRDLNHMILIYDRGIPSGILISFSGMLHPGLPIWILPKID